MQRYAFMFLMGASSIQAQEKSIHDALHHFGIDNVEVVESPISGLKTVISDQGVLYASNDGRYFIQGNLVHVNDRGEVQDLSNQPLMGRLEALKDEMIVYPAAKEEEVVTVFFDITCHYCKKLHEDIPELNKRGITVRYLAFPRQGMTSGNARRMESIFAAADAKDALERAERGEKMPETPVNKVRRHYQLGLQFGVQGTPAIITSRGELIGGYMKPQQLAEHIKQKRN